MIYRRYLALAAVSVLAACASTPPPPPALDLNDPTAATLATPGPEQYRVLFETSQGNFELEAIRAWAPNGADRFYNLVRLGFYNGVRFFRVLPGFVVQFGISGDPNITAYVKRSRIRDDEMEGSNTRGTISFAMSGPDTRTAQVFINLADNSRLDPLGFAPFGRVTSGMEVIDSLYSGYGEGAPQGLGPDQIRIEAEGTSYLQLNFPQLDSIVRVTILPD